MKKTKQANEAKKVLKEVYKVISQIDFSSIPKQTGKRIYDRIPWDKIEKILGV